MPTISLRLTDDQHAELKAWAFGARRSVQREIVWRLFTIEGGQAAKVGPSVATSREEVKVLDEPPISTKTPRKRLHPCPHYVPSSKVCEKCDL